MSARHFRFAATVLILPALAFAQGMNTISQVTVKGASIEITGSKKPNFTTFTMTDPPRLVIDISEATFSGVPDEIPVGNGTITAIRTANYGSDSAAIARVLIGFEKEVETDLQVVGVKKLVVKATPVASKAVAAAPPAAVDPAAPNPLAAATVIANQPSAAEKAADDKAAREAEARAQQELKKQQADAKAAEERAKKEEQLAQQTAAAEEKARLAEEARVKKEEQLAQKKALAEEKSRQADEARAEKERLAAEKQAARDAQAQEVAEAKRLAAEEKARQREEAKAAAAAAAEEKARAREEARAALKTAQEEQRAARAQAKEERLAMLSRNEARESSSSSASESGSPSGRRNTMTLVGFKPESSGKVFVRTHEPVRYTVEKVGDRAVVLELENTRIARENDRRPLDTSFFNSSVSRVVAESGEGRNVRIHIQLKENVPYQARQEGNEVVLDFGAGAGAQ